MTLEPAVERAPVEIWEQVIFWALHDDLIFDHSNPLHIVHSVRYHHDFRITRYQRLEANRITVRLVCRTWSEIALSTLRIYVHRRRKLGGTPPATHKLHYIDYSAQSIDLVTLINLLHSPAASRVTTLSVTICNGRFISSQIPQMMHSASTLNNTLRSLSLHFIYRPAELWFSLAEIANLFPQLAALSIYDCSGYEAPTAEWSMPHLEVFDYTSYSPFPYNPSTSKWHLPALKHLAIIFLTSSAESGIGPAMCFIQSTGPSLETLALGSVGFKLHVTKRCWSRLKSLKMLVVDDNVEGLQHLAVPPRLEVIFCAAYTIDLLPKLLIEWVPKTATDQKNDGGEPERATLTIQMAYTFTEILQYTPSKGFLQASAYDEWPSVLQQPDIDRILELAKTWGATGIRVEGIDGLTYEETNERHPRKDGIDNGPKELYRLL
jgi:hypothetical protein